MDDYNIHVATIAEYSKHIQSLQFVSYSQHVYQNCAGVNSPCPLIYVVNSQKPCSCVAAAVTDAHSAPTTNTANASDVMRRQNTRVRTHTITAANIGIATGRSADIRCAVAIT